MLSLHLVLPALVVQSLSGGPVQAITWLQREWLVSLLLLTVDFEFFFYSFFSRFDMFLLAQMVCSDKTQFACDNLCGNPLPCGNHYCSFTCHPLEIKSSSSDKRSESCEKCELRCQKVLMLCVKALLWSQLVRGNTSLSSILMYRRDHLNANIPVLDVAIQKIVHLAKLQ